MWRNMLSMLVVLGLLVTPALAAKKTKTPRPTVPTEAERVEQIKHYQYCLTEMGYYHGPITGVINPGYTLAWDGFALDRWGQLSDKIPWKQLWERYRADCLTVLDAKQAALEAENARLQEWLRQEEEKEQAARSPKIGA
jgi:hypothetical protein